MIGKSCFMIGIFTFMIGIHAFMIGKTGFMSGKGYFQSNPRHWHASHYFSFNLFQRVENSFHSCPTAINIKSIPAESRNAHDYLNTLVL